MRLADFIETHGQEILVEWEAFAATRLPAASGMNSLELQNHAPKMLQAIAADLRTIRNTKQQFAKSQGRATVLADAPQTAAEVHGIMRARRGFDISQMVSEYRALRASVLRLWGSFEGSADLNGVIEDFVRFNEAIDQAVAESVALFSEEVERGRNLFLGVLGHELRNPLNAIQMTARHLARIRSDALIAHAVQHLIDSGGRMKALLDDLLEYSRTRLSLGILIKPTETDLAEICASVIDEIKTAGPAEDMQFRTVGDVHGHWDRRRLHQVFSNLLGNALAYRTPSTPVQLELMGSERLVFVTVTNEGPPIPHETLESLFEPLQRGLQGSGPTENDCHLGLGLFVAREIVKAHHGEIEARSSTGKTVFTVRLPRQI
jgi:signal transduction histidine kinase